MCQTDSSRLDSHHVNSAPIFLTINAQPWITLETKARLMEWKIRYDLLQYAARGVPALSLDAIKAYQPKQAAEDSITSKAHTCPSNRARPLAVLCCVLTAAA